jgi:hypothetical protein
MIYENGELIPENSEEKEELEATRDTCAHAHPHALCRALAFKQTLDWKSLVITEALLEDIKDTLETL